MNFSVLPGLKSLWKTPAQAPYIAKNEKVRLSFLFSMADLRKFEPIHVERAVLALKSMSPDEYQGLYLRSKNEVHRADSNLLMRYLLTEETAALPATSSEEKIVPIEGLPRQWSRKDVLSCMDDLSGLSPAIPHGLDALVTTVFLRGSILMMGLAKHFLPELVGAPMGALLGNLAASSAHIHAISPLIGGAAGAVFGAVAAKVILFCMHGKEEIKHMEKDIKENQEKVAPWRFDSEFLVNRLKEVGLGGSPTIGPLIEDSHTQIKSPTSGAPSILPLVQPTVIRPKDLNNSIQPNVVSIKPPSMR
jgi:hypothetical protein